MRCVSISAPKVDVEEIEQKIRIEVADGNKRLQTLVNDLATENLELKSRISRVELEITELKKTIEKFLS